VKELRRIESRSTLALDCVSANFILARSRERCLRCDAIHIRRFKDQIFERFSPRFLLRMPDIRRTAGIYLNVFKYLVNTCPRLSCDYSWNAIEQHSALCRLYFLILVFYLYRKLYLSDIQEAIGHDSIHGCSFSFLSLSLFFLLFLINAIIAVQKQRCCEIHLQFKAS
jgi:hypothetical protein